MRIRTLDRYVGAQFLRMFALCLGGFVMIYLLVDFIERSSQIFKEDPAFTAVVMYFLYKLPLIVFQTIPIACLLGSLLSLMILARHSELTAVKAGGIPILRATASILVLASVISAAAFLIGEFVVPYANQKKEYIYKVEIKKHEWRVKYRKKNVYYKSGDSLFSFGLFVPEQGRVSQVRMYRFDAHYGLSERAVAESAEFKDGSWSMKNGTRWTFEDGRLTSTENFTALPIAIRETPEDMKVYQKDSEEMSWREMAALVRDLKAQGYDVTAYRTDMQGKLAFPLVPLIMAILGVPFAARVGRQGGIAVGVAVAMLIGVGYWIVLGMGLALGHTGKLPPFVAAWGSHIVFGLGGLVGLVKVRQ